MFIVQLVKMYNGVTAGIFALVYGKFHELLSKKCGYCNNSTSYAVVSTFSAIHTVYLVLINVEFRLLLTS